MEFSMKVISATAAVLVAAVLLGLILLYLRQDSMILFPNAEDAVGKSTQLDGALPWREGGEFRGFVFEPTGQVKGTILFFHGNAGAALYREAYAKKLISLSYRVVLAEYPGFGARMGEASLTSLLNASLDDTQRVRKTWSEPLYLMGESFGAGMAAMAAGAYPGQSDGVVLITPWNSLAALVNDKLPLPVAFLLRKRLDSAMALQSYPGNIVVVGAERDEIIPVVHAKALTDRLPNAVYIELPDADHNGWFGAMDAPTWTRVLALASGAARRQ
jgi:pimeloyl-ACP methyl ester carboxylesterase